MKSQKINSGKKFHKGAAIFKVGCMIAIQTFTLAGCGKADQVYVPKLMEPIATSLSFRPVEKHRIGNVEMMYGAVVPTAYPCYAEKMVTLAELFVQVGDEVKQGDVIARADCTALSDELSGLKNRLIAAKEQKKLNEDISKERLTKLSYQKKLYKKMKDKSGTGQVETDIALEKENERYDNSLLSQEIKEYNERIAELEEEISEHTFTAPHDGYVSYVKDVRAGSTVSAYENIAVISDESEPYIEAESVTIQDYRYEGYETKWANIGGRNVELDEYRYTNDELIFAQTRGQYPAVRFRTEGTLVMGTTIPLYFVKGGYRECLAVGNDSIYQEDDRAYVYVQGDDGELCKKQVTLGESDRYYSEVIEGLAEGELVFYENSALVPTAYDKVQAEVSDYQEDYVTEYCEPAVAHYDIYLAGKDGRVNPDVAKEGEVVRLGDELLSISTVTGKAELYEAKTALENLDSLHAENEKNYEREKKRIEKEIQAKEKNLKKYSADTSKGESSNTDALEKSADTADTGALTGDTDNTAVKILEYEKEMLTCDLNLLKMQRKHENAGYKREREQLASRYQALSGAGSGDGDSLVLTKQDGIMGKVMLEDEGTVSEGSFLTAVKIESDMVLLAKMKSGVSSLGGNDGQPAKLGQTIEIDVDGKTYTGSCVGRSGVDSYSNLFTRDGRIVLTNSEKRTAKQFSIRLAQGHVQDICSNSEKVEIRYKGSEMKGVLTIPAEAVYTEMDSLTQQEQDYVWRIVDGELVKQYVVVYDGVVGAGKVMVLYGLSEKDSVAVE